MERNNNPNPAKRNKQGISGTIVFFKFLNYVSDEEVLKCSEIPRNLQLLLGFRKYNDHKEKVKHRSLIHSDLGL